MYKALMNIVFGSATVTITEAQEKIITWGSVILAILAFVMITVFFYKLMMFIIRF